MISIKVQRYSQNHAQKLHFLRHPMGASGTTYVLYLKVVAEFHRENAGFVCETAN